MAKKQEKRLGISIDPAEIRLVEMTLVGGKMRVHKAATFACPGTDEQSLRDTLEKGLDEFGRGVLVACLVISDKLTAFDLTHLPTSVRTGDRKKVLDRKAVQISTESKEGWTNFQIAHRQTRQVVREGNTMLEFQVQTCSQETVEQMVRLAEGCGLKIESLVSWSEAQRCGLEALIPEDEKTGILNVDLGKTSTRVLLFSGGHWLYSRTLAKGIDAGHALDGNALRLGLGAESEESEDGLFGNIGTGGPFGETDASTPPPAPGPAGAQAIPQVLLGEIRRNILFLERQFSLKISKVLISGVLKAEASLLQEVGARVDRPAELPTDDRFEAESGIAFSPFLGPYAAALGGILASDEANGLNLLPVELRPQRGIKLTRTLIPIAGIVMPLVLAGIYWFTDQRIDYLRDQIDMAEPFLRMAREHEEKKTEDPDQSMDKYRSDLLLRMYDNQSPITLFLEIIQNKTPPRIALPVIRAFRYGDNWFGYAEGKLSGDILELQDLKQNLDVPPVKGPVETRWLPRTPADQGATPFRIWIPLWGLD